MVPLYTHRKMNRDDKMQTQNTSFFLFFWHTHGYTNISLIVLHIYLPVLYGIYYTWGDDKSSDRYVNLYMRIFLCIFHVFWLSDCYVSFSHLYNTCLLMFVVWNWILFSIIKNFIWLWRYLRYEKRNELEKIETSLDEKKLK